MIYPNQTDNYNIELFNQNFRELEEKTKQLEGEIGGVEDFGTVSINLESQDESDPQTPSDMPLWTSGKKTIGNLFKDISTAIKNTRYLMKLIGDLGKKVEIPSADGKYRFNIYRKYRGERS